MARFVLAGKTDCPHFAKAERLGEQLQGSLPYFRLHRILIPPDEWKEWLDATCRAHGWRHGGSPLVWRELVHRGGGAMLLGGLDDFQEHCQEYYGVVSDMSSDMMLKIAVENRDMEEKGRKEAQLQAGLLQPLRVWICGALNPTCSILIPHLLSGQFFPWASSSSSSSTTSSSIVVSLHLLHLEGEEEVLDALRIETEELGLPLLHKVTVHADLEEAFRDADLIILLDEQEEPCDQRHGENQGEALVGEEERGEQEREKEEDDMKKKEVGVREEQEREEEEAVMEEQEREKEVDEVKEEVREGHEEEEDIREEKEVRVEEREKMEVREDKVEEERGKVEEVREERVKEEREKVEDKEGEVRAEKDGRDEEEKDVGDKELRDQEAQEKVEGKEEEERKDKVEDSEKVEEKEEEVRAATDEEVREMGREEKELLQRVSARYHRYGQLIGEWANRRGVRVMVAGNAYINLKCALLMESAPSVDPGRFIAVATPVEQAARVRLAQKLSMRATDVRDVTVWGNLSGSFHVDLQRARVFNHAGAIQGPPSFSRPVLELLHDRDWLKTDLPALVSGRRATVATAPQGVAPAAMSVAHGILTVLQAWCGVSCPEEEGRVFSLGVCCQGHPFVPDGVVCSVPVTFSEGGWRPLLEGVHMGDELRETLRLAVDQLRREKEEGRPGLMKDTSSGEV